ncbi:MAG TPA: pyridoxamine 5'-phosphate oxidase family protein [Blastocatellia bacterium]|nr:pyridoxamine 5'-phosphate oxidase family protein [Blastocatellia bacterium]
MGKILKSITPDLAAFIKAQPLFFVATAPLAATGHVNLSPKGLDTFRVLSANRVAYLDLTGSGNETSAHVTENSRITFMFCSFGENPLILRLYGKGQVVLPGSDLWPEAASHFPVYPGIRQVVMVDVEFVQTSCGFGVPLMEYGGDRDRLCRWVKTKGEEGLREYHRTKNAKSLDGLDAPLRD